jgi:hypothetical protein
VWKGNLYPSEVSLTKSDDLLRECEFQACLREWFKGEVNSSPESLCTTRDEECEVRGRDSHVSMRMCTQCSNPIRTVKQVHGLIFFY